VTSTKNFTADPVPCPMTPPSGSSSSAACAAVASSSFICRRGPAPLTVAKGRSLPITITIEIRPPELSIHEGSCGWAFALLFKDR
jgi:hypothetical protein